MKKESKKSNRSNEAQLLELLKQVLPKATPDPKLAGLIYSAVEKELSTKNREASFAKFCERVELPDLEPASVASVQRQFAESFTDGTIEVKPNKKKDALVVEVTTKDGTQFSNEVKVRPLGPEESDEQEIVPKFVPFPVALPGDEELVWILAKRETMTPEEGNIVLAKIEEDFWASKAGQKLIRDRVEKSFPEFISRVPAGMLTELGLKRHYKTPEPVKVLRPAVPKK